MAKKVYHGETNDKERSKQKLINAVGEVLKNKGYAGLTATNISKKAGLSRRLITMHFDSLDNLIETYVRNKDYWNEAAGDFSTILEEKKSFKSKEIIERLLQNQLDYFYESTEMQKLILWEISEKSKIMYEACKNREHLGSKIFELADQEFKEKDIRAVAALLVAGIYYMVLHSKSTNTLFCGIDINNQEGMKRIKNAISLILENA